MNANNGDGSSLEVLLPYILLYIVLYFYCLQFLQYFLISTYSTPTTAYFSQARELHLITYDIYIYL
uniref:Ovule protein n=1 Tax=Heterorhabditis bacteriophora TaxID=37862 RepID=A0A1I7WJG8_HETBA